MATSQIIPMRLKVNEVRMLDQICRSKERGDYNRSEMIRLLITREFNRRTFGTSKVEHSNIASDFRNGRPRPEKILKGS